MPEERADLVDLKTAANEFGLSVMTLYRYMADGRLTRHERARGRPRVFIDRRELRKLLEPRPVRRGGKK